MTADPVVFPRRPPSTPPRGVARPSRAQPCHTAVVIENAITHPEGGREGKREEVFTLVVGGKESEALCLPEAMGSNTSDNSGIIPPRPLMYYRCFFSFISQVV